MAPKPDRERKLAVLLHADVVGSTVLVQQNETLAHERITEVFALFSNCITTHGGTVHEVRGDALIAEFERASDAVAGALAAQAASADYNLQLTDEIQPQLRVGIALGEVVIADSTITGPGIVLAQRLEQLAEAGGVCVQGSVYEAVPQRLPFKFANLGEHALKGFEEPVRAFSVVLVPGAEIPQAEAQLSKQKPSNRIVLFALGAALVSAVVLGAAWWWMQPDVEPADEAAMAFALPAIPSLAVLPFDNFSGNPEEEALALGISENLTATLAEINGLLVVARNSAFAFKGGNVPIKTVAEKLSVQYVLEGSVQRSGSQIRVTAQLIDALSGKHVWAETYDRQVGNYFEIQDDIALSVATELRVHLTAGDAARLDTTRNLAAFMAMRRADAQFYQFSREPNLKARDFARKAIELDATYVAAHARLGWTYALEARSFWVKDTAAAWRSAEEHAKKAIAMRADKPEGYFLLAYIRQFNQRDYAEAERLYEQALALYPANTDVMMLLGSLALSRGQWDRTIELRRKTLRLAPQSPSWTFVAMGYAHVFKGEFETAIALAEEGLKHKAPPLRLAHLHSVVVQAHAAAGRLEEARVHAKKFLELDPKATVERMASFYSFEHPEHANLYQERFAAAGIPSDGHRRIEPARPDKMAFALPDKPSIAVLPFDNMSGDASQEYFSDGMTEDLITDLSKVSGLFVIARTSSFWFKGKSVTIRDVAEKLGVRYVLEGSVRRSGRDVRINAQLIDAVSGGHLWAERYDGTIENVFALQDQVTGAIVRSLKVELLPAEREGLAQVDTLVPAAHEAFLVGLSHQEKTLDSFRRAKAAFEEAVAHDPTYARAWGALAELYYLAFRRNFADELGLDMSAVPSFIEKAIRIPNVQGYDARLHDLVEKARYDELRTRIEELIEFDPNYPDGYAWRAYIAAFDGKTDEALRDLEVAKRLNPKDPVNDGLFGLVYLQIREYQTAISYLSLGNAGDPNSIPFLAGLTAAQALGGRLADAKANAVELVVKRKSRGHTETLVRSIDMLGALRNSQLVATVQEGLRLAGLPEAIKPGELNLDERQRLVGEDLRQFYEEPRRSIGPFLQGKWMRDTFPNRLAVYYFNGERLSLAEWYLENDERVSVHRAPSTRGLERCKLYINPNGTKEGLDEYIATCLHGVFPFATFAVPDDAYRPDER